MNTEDKKNSGSALVVNPFDAPAPEVETKSASSTTGLPSENPLQSLVKAGLVMCCSIGLIVCCIAVGKWLIDINSVGAGYGHSYEEDKGIFEPPESPEPDPMFSGSSSSIITD